MESSKDRLQEETVLREREEGLRWEEVLKRERAETEVRKTV